MNVLSVSVFQHHCGIISFIQGLESYTVRKSKSVHNELAFPKSSVEILGQNSKINVRDRDSGDWTWDINSVQQTLAG